MKPCAWCLTKYKSLGLPLIRELRSGCARRPLAPDALALEAVSVLPLVLSSRPVGVSLPAAISDPFIQRQPLLVSASVLSSMQTGRPASRMISPLPR